MRIFQAIHTDCPDCTLDSVDTGTVAPLVSCGESHWSLIITLPKFHFRSNTPPLHQLTPNLSPPHHMSLNAATTSTISSLTVSLSLFTAFLPLVILLHLVLL